MDKPYEDPYSATDALGQAEAVLSSDPERARLLLYRVAHNHYIHREPFFNDWARAKELARQLAFGVSDRPAELAQTFSIISRLNRRLGLHRDAFLTAMYAFQQQTLAWSSSKEFSLFLSAANDVSDSLDRVKLVTTDHVLLDSMSRVLLTTGPIPVRDSPLGWNSNAREMAKIISDLHWKLALKSALTPRQASKYVKIADRANRLYHQLDRPTPSLEQFARQCNGLCIADLIDERNELI